MAVEIRTVPRLSTKDPAEKVDYSIGFTLDSGDTISSASVSGITTGLGLTVASTGVSTVVVQASGGTQGDLYYFATEIVTVGGRRFKRETLLPVDER